MFLGRACGKQRGKYNYSRRCGAVSAKRRELFVTFKNTSSVSCHLVLLHGLQAAVHVGQGDPLVDTVGEPGGGEAELGEVGQDHSVPSSFQDAAHLKALEINIHLVL